MLPVVSTSHLRGAQEGLSVSGSQLDLMAPMVSGSGRCPALFADQFWAGFIHLQRPVIQTCAVHSRDRSPSLFGTGHLDEGKPTGLTRVTILYDCDTLDCAMRLEEHSQLLFTCFEVKISNENVRHGLNVLLSNLALIEVLPQEDERSEPHADRFFRIAV
jgi:hypothetical protein